MPRKTARVNWHTLWPRMLASLKSILERDMTTRSVISSYFTQVERKTGWDALLADNVVFTSFTSPNQQLSGKQTFIEATKQFYSSIQSFEVKGLLVEGSQGCALTRYRLQGPAGAFESDVAEIYSVRNGKIASLGIYFDPAPFPK